MKIELVNDERGTLAGSNAPRSKFMPRTRGGPGRPMEFEMPARSNYVPGHRVTLKVPTEVGRTWYQDMHLGQSDLNQPRRFVPIVHITQKSACSMLESERSLTLNRMFGCKDSDFSTTNVYDLLLKPGGFMRMKGNWTNGTLSIGFVDRIPGNVDAPGTFHEIKSLKVFAETKEEEAYMLEAHARILDEAMLLDPASTMHLMFPLGWYDYTYCYPKDKIIIERVQL